MHGLMIEDSHILPLAVEDVLVERHCSEGDAGTV